MVYRVCIYIYIYTHIYVLICIHMYISYDICMYICTYVQMHIRTYVQREREREREMCIHVHVRSASRSSRWLVSSCAAPFLPGPLASTYLEVTLGSFPSCGSEPKVPAAEKAASRAGYYLLTYELACCICTVCYTLCIASYLHMTYVMYAVYNALNTIRVRVDQDFMLKSIMPPNTSNTQGIRTRRVLVPEAAEVADGAAKAPRTCSMFTSSSVCADTLTPLFAYVVFACAPPQRWQCSSEVDNSTQLTGNTLAESSYICIPPFEASIP